MLFKIFPLKKTFHLLLIILALSTTTTITSEIALGSLHTISSSVSGAGSVTVFSSSSRLPQTGIISLNVAEVIKELKNVEMVSPEVLSLVIVRNHILFLRGMSPEAFICLDEPRLIEGEIVLEGDYALIGIRAANMLDIKIDETIVVKGLTTSASKTMVIKGIFETGGPLDDEILATVSTGQFLRGFTKEDISLIRVKGALPYLKANIASLLGLNETDEGGKSILTDWSRLMPTSTITSSSKSEVLKLGAEDILNRNISFSQSILWALMSIVLGASSIALYYAVSWVLMDSLKTITILRAVGFPRTKVRAMLFLEALLISLTAAVSGYGIGYTLMLKASEGNTLRIFFHTIVPPFRMDIFLSLLLLPTILALTFLFICLRNEDRSAIPLS